MHSSLPPLYDGWLQELLHGDIPEEPLATCDHCAMVNDANHQSSGSFSFRADIKCCTYLPYLANFLVGRILRDRDPGLNAGRETVVARIGRSIGVTPLALEQDARFVALYDGSNAAFGRNQTLRCPHLLADGKCGVWRHRESTCATWFCKYRRGAVGFAFWSALANLLRAVERSLAMWCLIQLQFPSSCVENLLHSANPTNRQITVHELDQSVDISRQRSIWGEWLGREADFYQQCANIIDSLDWTMVCSICGPDVTARARVVHEKYQELLSDKIPERLTIGSFRLVQISANSAHAVGYSDFDPIKMNRALYEALPLFDGRLLEDACERIRAEKGTTISHAVVRQLVDHQILRTDQPSKSNG